MIKNYFIVAIRNFWRTKVFSLINIAGLAIGISAALVIYLIVQNEFSFEKFQPDGNRKYRIVSDMHFPDMEFKNGGVPGPLVAAVRNELPNVEKSTSFWTAGITKVKIPGRSDAATEFKSQDNIIYADAYYFRFFNYEWIAGSPDRSLTGPNKVVLTESRAHTYFSFADVSNAIGQTIIYGDSLKVTVTGIVKDYNHVTDFTFKEFISLPTFENQLKQQNGWDEWGNLSSSSQFFVQLKPGTDTAQFDKQLAAVRRKHEKEAYLGMSHFVQPLYDLHFNPSYDVFNHRQANSSTLYGLMAVAAFLLLLGCINFINLTTAQASQRAKEIGVRKTMGSSKKQLIFQFLTETIFITSLAGCLSILLTPWLLEVFSAYIPQGVSFGLIAQPKVIAFVVLLVLLVSLLSGIYPALILSGFKPTVVLKNLAYAGTSQSRRTWIRKTLTVTQFVIAQFFIIATFVVGKQIRYSLNQDMGFKKNAIINFTAPVDYDKPDNKQFVLQQKLKTIPGIQTVSLGGPPPAANGMTISTMKVRNKEGKEVESTVEIKYADTAYLKVYNIKLLAGRNLQQSDTTREYLVNANYAKSLGYTNPEQIIGQTIDRNNSRVPIVGVVADIHTKSTHSPIGPLAITSAAKYHSVFHIALPDVNGNTDGWKKTITSIGVAWKQVYPEADFNYQFFDDTIARFYKQEQDTASLLNWCTGLAVFISCLGLLGLVIYTTTQRTKEIGVRKVLGASISQIVSLLSKDFMKLVALAFVIAAPLAWWAMHKWLEDFAFRTEFSWWIFAMGGGFMFLIATITLSIQTFRSAMANPVKSLRTE